MNDTERDIAGEIDAEEPCIFLCKSFVLTSQNELLMKLRRQRAAQTNQVPLASDASGTSDGAA